MGAEPAEGEPLDQFMATHRVKIYSDLNTLCSEAGKEL
jgi:hypothetical protein